MYESDDLTRIVRKAADRFASSIKRFRAWHGNEGITEANQLFQFAAAFLEMHPHGFVFMEVPFAAKEGGRTSNRLDAYLVSGEIAYLLECKRLWTPEGAAAIASDIARMRPPLLETLKRRHVHSPPTRCHGVVLADAWHPEIVRWWCRHPESKKRWPRDGFPEDWQFDSIEVLKWSDKPQGTLYWLYGIGPNLNDGTASG